MTKENIIASARIFAKLQTVLKKDNGTDVINAARNPIKMMVIYNKEAFARRVLNEETQRYLCEEYDKFTLEEFEAGLEESLSLPNQGVWQLAYDMAKQEFRK
nr:MAG TPA: hypothetical protein [Caudoviricetes sp.]